MKSKIQVFCPLWLALFIYWLITFALLSVSVMRTHGHFGYPLDDTYIHMAMAKHFIKDGFWGVSQTGFSSSTSSPLWTLLITLTYFLLGINDWTPFALCLICGSSIIITSYYLIRKKCNTLWLTILLVFIVLFTPLAIWTLMGMEHILHALFSIWLIYCVATYLNKSQSNSYLFVLLLLLAGLVTITRYEGLFLVFTIVILFLSKKRFLEAFLTVIAGILPITMYGIYSIAQGWFFFPNSILLKGNVPILTLAGITHLLGHLPSNLFAAPHILVLLIVCLGTYLWSEKQKYALKKERNLIVIFVIMTFLHMEFSSMGILLFRYEAYLVLAGILILMDTITSLAANQTAKVGSFTNRIVIFVLWILFVLPLAWGTAISFRNYPFAVMNIFEQQYQMGLFLDKYYSGKAVAANDIGEINYLADIKTLDLYGLGSIEVARAKRNGLYDKKVIDDLVSMSNVEVVIIYNSGFEGNIPSDWVEIGRWQIGHNVICFSDEVSFYAPNASEKNNVISNLREFSALLPSTVKQSGIYITP
jgi:hypothetical protein